MALPLSCPSVPVLREFVAGRLGEPEAGPIRDHVALCASCRRRVDDLETELVPGSDIPSSIPTRSLSQTSEVSPQQATQEPPAAPDETIELGFLRPSADPRSLGRIGAYEIRGVLGQGGMGIVFKAFDESLQRVVAIKVLAPALATSQTARRRFIREARAAAAINHPNIVTIHAVDTDGELPYLVMESIAGRSLRHRIKTGPPLSLPEILRIGVQVATGLAAAHEQGVIHRDIKPANIMLEEGVERVKITDFGLALAALDHSALTSQGQIVGTPAYMSPEQIAGVAVDARSDLFSLGCVFYAMATGHSPFQGAMSLDVLRKVADLRPDRLETVDPRIPRDVSMLVERLLEKDPEKRPATATEVATLLKEQLAQVNRAASNSAVEMPAVPAGSRPRAERWPWVLAFVGTTAVILALGVFLVTRNRTPDPRAAVIPRRPPAPKPAAPTAFPRGLITVAKSGRADFPTIQQALEAAGPGDRIRVRDDATYDESIAIVDAKKTRGLTLEAPRGASLVSASEMPALTIRNTRFVTVRGFRVTSGATQHSLVVDGATTDLTIEDVTFTQTASGRFHSAVVRISADGSEARSVLLRRCRIMNNGLGVALVNSGPTNRQIGSVELQDNDFAGPGVHVLIQGRVRNVLIAGNRFLGGINGVNLDFPVPLQVGRLAIHNNTFSGTTYWIGLVRTDPQQKGISICNNLILDSERVEWGWAGQLDDAARSWEFRSNWWEPSARTALDRLANPPMAELHPTIALRSRDPADPGYLQPEPGSPVATSGIGGELPTYIGARAPASPPQ
jgi:hypothetical protein